MFDRTRFQQGQDVYDVNGNKVGSINNVSQNFLDVSAGFLGFDHLHIPFGEISRVEGNRVYLSVPKDQIGNQNWQPQPTANQGMYGTMPAVTEEAPGYIRGMPTQLSGYDIYTSDNDKLGTILDEGPTFLHLQTGFLGLGQDLYVPRDCVERCDANNHRCYLGVTKDQVSNMNWTRRPAPGEAYSCGTGRPVSTGRAAERPISETTAAPRGEGEVERLPLVETGITPEIERERLGEVEVTKRVEEHNVSYNVPVTHEEVVIREEPVNRPTNVEPNEKGDIRVPIYGEKVDVEKESRVYGEVEIEKRRVTEQKHVEGTVRREVPEIHRKGDVEDDVQVEGNLEKRDDNNPPPRRMQR
ncbi:MAG TPA: PRC and DUF2382 domain-containing protein [Chloroflexota bacterium]|nr:PRC and DUF2382 domain-containing protein [Chloroflexota bacterium]